MRALPIALGASLLAACFGESPSSPVEPFEVLPHYPPTAAVQVYIAAPGDSVRVLFFNSSDVLYSFAPCTRRVERIEGGLWVDLNSPGTDCSGSPVVVPAESITERRFDVPWDASPGQYRYRFVMFPPIGPAISVPTGPFQVL